MALKGKVPEAKDKRLKMLVYGPPGVGKTWMTLEFPRPYLIDTERGAENDQYVRKLKAVNGAYYFTTDPDELISEVLALIATKHEYQTLVIDPLTVVYNDLLDKAAEEVGTDFGRHKGPADRKVKHLLALLLRLDMNVVITSHAKAKWVRAKDNKGKDTVVEDGMTFDCYARLDYLFDLVIEGKREGDARVGIVRKSRIEAMPEGSRLPFSYSAIAEKYGRETLERIATPVTLADEQQVAEAGRLVSLLKIGDDVVAKWLDKAGAESWSEMPSDAIAKCIEWCRNRIKNGGES